MPPRARTVGRGDVGGQALDPLLFHRPVRGGGDTGAGVARAIGNFGLGGAGVAWVCHVTPGSQSPRPRHARATPAPMSWDPRDKRVADARGAVQSVRGVSKEMSRLRGRRRSVNGIHPPVHADSGFRSPASNVRQPLENSGTCNDCATDPRGGGRLFMDHRALLSVC
eukprot:gene14316-biopygen12628